MSKSTVCLVSIFLVLSLGVAGCGGGGDKTTTSSNPGTTSSNPSNTTTQNTTTTTNPTTTSNSTTLPAIGVSITTHSAAVLTAYKGLCQTCHGKGLPNSNPYPPSWDGKASGSTHNTGVYPITPGSPADHTSYTMDDCTKAGCHAVSTAAPTSTGDSTLFIDPKPGGKPTALKTHGLVGFENCVPCHVGSTAVGSNKKVGESHSCDECHATEPEPSYDPGHEGVGFPSLPMQTSCIICHKTA